MGVNHKRQMVPFLLKEVERKVTILRMLTTLQIKQKEIENLGPSETRHNLTTRLKKTISGIHTQKEPDFALQERTV